MRDFSPSMLLYGTLPLFWTNFPRCHALLCFVTSSLASPIAGVCEVWFPFSFLRFISFLCSIFVKQRLLTWPVAGGKSPYVHVLIPKTIGNRKGDCAWGCAWGINTTWENLQIEKHKSVRWAERTPSWFVLFDLQIFSGGVYSPSATSRTISFSISNSFWY